MTKVLVIEDSEDIRENILEILTLAGYNVTVAQNGKSGVEIAKKEIPDIILCDVMMPELDGYGVIHILRKQPETATIPFIFITAKADRTDVRKGMEMGADDYLTKPFDAIELLNAIEARLHKNEQQKERYGGSIGQLDELISHTDGLAELKKIIRERDSRHFKKNQVIHYEGDSVLGIYFVVSGKIKAVRLAEDGRSLITGMYGAEEFMDVSNLLSKEPYSYTATALEDSQLCFFPKEQLEKLLRSYPDVAVEFLTILSNEIHQKDGHLLQLAYQSVRKRIAESIITLFHNHGEDGESVKVSREDLASMSGAASETVSRTLTEFKNEGLIGKKGSHLTILDFKKISGMKN